VIFFSSKYHLINKLILDPRINDITDKIDIDVESSAAKSTYQPFRSVNSYLPTISYVSVSSPVKDIMPYL
jgi:hypothetical protein